MTGGCVRRTRLRHGAVLALLLALSGCGLVPKQRYTRPAATLPPSWSAEAPWRVATPADAEPKGPWWTAFQDPELDRLQILAMQGNQTLFAAAARLQQARATYGAASAGLYPSLSTNARVARFKISGNRPLTSYTSPVFSTVQNDFTLGLSVNYEFDLFGRVAGGIDVAGASAEQSAADLENVRLLVQSDLASAYFNLRATDIEIDALQRSLALQRRSLQLATDRHDLGATSGLDVAQQQALLDSTLVQLDVLARQRAQFEHAVATVAGVPAPVFSLAPAVRIAEPPRAPIGVPSDLLERRPDVAAAERAMAAANAQIGVVRASYFPSLILGPSIGLDSRGLGKLLDASSLLWSLGISATQVLFDAGRIDSNVDFARAGYDVAVANYRRTVLVAMQETEDGLSGLSSLDRAYAQAQRAIASAQKVLELATVRYEGGVATYLEVITAQQSLQNAERLAAQLAGQRLLVAVFLFKALGGDYRLPQQQAAR